MLFGVDYYPEQWDEARWRGDARQMARMGFEAVRIMEFAWALVEPEPGRYDFGLFDRALGVLAQAGLKAVIGTPSAASPAWFRAAHPDSLQTHPSGRSRAWGTRRECCVNHGGYRDACRALAEAIGRHYGSDDRIIGFQVDNEPGHDGSDRCVCPSCQIAFQSWLRSRYQSVQDLNRAWGNVFWSRLLDDFSQVPLPSSPLPAPFNPALLLDFDRFCSDSYASFIQDQVLALRRHCGQKWVTTNLFPPPLSHALDMESICSGMDFASFDNYPVWGDQDEPYPYHAISTLHDYTRGVSRGRPFCVMEQFVGQQGQVCLGHLPDPRRVALWTYQAMARGADKVFYFRYRTAAFGQEQLCLGLLDNDDRPTRRSMAIVGAMRRARAEFAPFASCPYPAKAALIYDKDNLRILREQYLSQGLNQPVDGKFQIGCDVELGRQSAPFGIFNVNCDIRGLGSLASAQGGLAHALTAYRLISLPLHQMADPALAEALVPWVEAGGSLILSWRSGTRDLRNWSIDACPPGVFRHLAGLEVREFESLNRGKIGLRLRGLPPLPGVFGQVWADLIDPIEAKAIAWYRDPGKYYSGRVAATRRSLGKGQVYYLGCSPGPLALFLLYRAIFKRAGLGPRFFGFGLEAIERTGRDGQAYTVVLNHNPRPRWVLGRRVEAWGMRVIRRGRPWAPDEGPLPDPPCGMA